MNVRSGVACIPQGNEHPPCLFPCMFCAEQREH